jgi:DNA-directed RNA polymerase subunit omega
MRGKEPRVEWDNDKPTVVALREIAAGFTNINNINTTETREDNITLLHEPEEKQEASAAHPLNHNEE